MTKLKYLIFICIAQNILMANGIAQSFQHNLKVQEFVINNRVYQIEIARTPKQLSMGLMGRSLLSENKGMLFVFPSIKRHGIWMRNMRIPLTVAWLDSNYKVIDVIKMVPCRSNPCPIFKSSQPSLFVVELNVSNNIQKGDQLFSK